LLERDLRRDGTVILKVLPEAQCAHALLLFLYDVLASELYRSAEQSGMTVARRSQTLTVASAGY
jgi:hypothetical protein